MPNSKIAQTAAAGAGSAEQVPGFMETGPTDAFWRRIERMLAEIAGMAKSESLPTDFPARVLVALHDALPSPGGIFWTQDLNGRLRQNASYFPDAHYGLCDRHEPGDQHGKNALAIDEAVHQRLVQGVLESGTARSASVEFSRDLPYANGSQHTAAKARNGVLLFCPITTEGGSTGVLELIQDDDSGLGEQLLLEVLRSAAELCADYLRRFQLQELTQERAAREQFSQFTRRIHDSLDVAATAYTIANEGRNLIDCDRVTVLACRGPDCQTLAVSGAARWDRRSNTIVGLERLAGAVAEGGDALVYCEGTGNLPPQVRVPLEAYLEEVQAREIIVVPLIRRNENAESAPRPSGVLIVEQFSGVLTEAKRELAAEICEMSTPALAHALEVQRIPWAGFFRDRDWRVWVRRGRKTLVAVACVLVLVLAACIIPADFTIEARGVLEPQSRRDIFAPDDGIVEELAVDHGSAIAVGQQLVVLRNPQLDLDLKRVWGELQAARKRLAAIETARVEAATVSASTPVSAARLSGEDAELQVQVESLSRQHRLLQEHQAELSVCSPIAGQVLTWDLPQLLRGRPVHRGQVLMIVADPSGPWQLELEVPDRDAGHVIEARARKGVPELPVTYLIATDPGTPHEAVIDNVAQSIERSNTGEPALRAVVRVKQGVLPNSRPGSTVIAKIHCGRRSLAYVWLRDLYYAVMTRLLF